MAKDLKFVLLMDCYNKMLTDNQRDAMELYYCEDLSLSEISEPRGITRQAVHCIIKQSEQKLLEMEEKLGFAGKFAAINKYFEKLQELAAEVENISIKKELNFYIEKGLSVLSDD